MCVVGPNGSGKTFICEAFAAQTGRVVVTLSQIRSQWFGQTDVLTENFESALAVFGRILVAIDEAHVAFGSIHDPGTHETEARLARNIIQMMDNESARSNVFWALMTTRPDLLDPDIVRRGRCSLFVPIFDPEGEDAEDFIKWMLARFERDGVILPEADIAMLRERSVGFSAGDYREFIGDFLEEREFDPQITVAAFLDNWTPTAVTLAQERELQTLLAALRCDWRELLPARLQGLSRADIQCEIDRLLATRI
jgi:SpoVK/Ycf46/Vps4 family AAA+-type ATPase